MTDFDGLRCVVAPGDGIVARFVGVVCVVPSLEGSARPLTAELIELCREAAGGAPGRTLARRLATWLTGLGDAAEGLAFGTVAVTADDRLAVFLLGDVTVLIPELNIEVSGADAAAWTDRLLARPDCPVVLAATRDVSPDEAVSSILDLHAGVVPGAAVVLFRRGDMDEVAVDEIADPHQPANPVPVEASSQGLIDSGPGTVESVTAPRRPGLSVEAETSHVEAVPGRPGDPPRSRLLIDAADDYAGSDPAPAGPHAVPVLGRLVFDTGSTYTVDGGYLIGRNPSADERVLAGTLRSIAVDDYSGTVSRVHAEISVHNWDVTVCDAGSSNGTFVAEPGKQWVQLRGSEPVRLTPGTQVRLGDAVFVFDAPPGTG